MDVYIVERGMISHIEVVACTVGGVGGQGTEGHPVPPNQAMPSRQFYRFCSQFLHVLQVESL